MTHIFLMPKCQSLAIGIWLHLQRQGKCTQMLASTLLGEVCENKMSLWDGLGLLQLLMLANDCFMFFCWRSMSDHLTSWHKKKLILIFDSWLLWAGPPTITMLKIECILKYWSKSMILLLISFCLPWYCHHLVHWGHGLKMISNVGMCVQLHIVITLLSALFVDSWRGITAPQPQVSAAQK